MKHVVGVLYGCIKNISVTDISAERKDGTPRILKALCNVFYLPTGEVVEDEMKLDETVGNSDTGIRNTPAA